MYYHRYKYTKKTPINTSRKGWIYQVDKDVYIITSYAASIAITFQDKVYYNEAYYSFSPTTKRHLSKALGILAKNHHSFMAPAIIEQDSFEALVKEFRETTA